MYLYGIFILKYIIMLYIFIGGYWLALINFIFVRIGKYILINSVACGTRIKHIINIY